MITKSFVSGTTLLLLDTLDQGYSQGKTFGNITISLYT